MALITIDLTDRERVTMAHNDVTGDIVLVKERRRLMGCQWRVLQYMELPSTVFSDAKVWLPLLLGGEHQQEEMVTLRETVPNPVLKDEPFSVTTWKSAKSFSREVRTMFCTNEMLSTPIPGNQDHYVEVSQMIRFSWNLDEESSDENGSSDEEARNDEYLQLFTTPRVGKHTPWPLLNDPRKLGRQNGDREVNVSEKENLIFIQSGCRTPSRRSVPNTPVCNAPRKRALGRVLINPVNEDLLSPKLLKSEEDDVSNDEEDQRSTFRTAGPSKLLF